MASVNELIGVLYQIVQSTWIVASITAKYYLLGAGGYLLYRDNLSVESFLEKILDDGKDFIFTVTGLGIIFYVLSIELRPLLGFFSQLTAVVYLGYLFWKY